MQIVSIIYMMAIFALLLPGIRIAKKGQFIENAHDLAISKGLQGNLMMFILIHQLSVEQMYLPGNKHILEWFENIGILCVAFYFFFSGFGIVRSIKTKPDYLKTFIVRRVWTVLVPFFICNYAYIFMSLILGVKYKTDNLIAAFFGYKLLNQDMWFAIEIMIIYLACYFIFRFVKKERLQYILVGVVILLLITFGFFTGYDYSGQSITNWFEGEWWYNTVITFLVGMLFARFYEPIVCFIKKHYAIVLILLLAGVTLLFMQDIYLINERGYWTDTYDNPAYLDKALTLLGQTGLIIAYVILVFVIMLKVRMHNKVLKFLGKISLEAILLQRTFAMLFARISWNINIHVYCLGITALTLFAALWINKIKLVVLEKK